MLKDVVPTIQDMNGDPQRARLTLIAPARFCASAKSYGIGSDRRTSGAPARDIAPIRVTPEAYARIARMPLILVAWSVSNK